MLAKLKKVESQFSYEDKLETSLWFSAFVIFYLDKSTHSRRFLSYQNKC